ncbi:MAG TPA: hypothetical protein VN959_13165 [Mycobacterium sp.]|jgi:hypothetical protein|nr:hypothetical protein [Mycobacterium sp.]
MLLLEAPARVSGIGGDTASNAVYLAALGALIFWVVVYLVYRVVMTGRKDFGMPVRRRVLCAHMRVDHDLSAEVPFWWTDIQVLHAVRAHWRETLRLPFGSGSEQKPNLVHSRPGA